MQVILQQYFQCWQNVYTYFSIPITKKINIVVSVFPKSLNFLVFVFRCCSATWVTFATFEGILQTTSLPCLYVQSTIPSLLLSVKTWLHMAASWLGRSAWLPAGWGGAHDCQLVGEERMVVRCFGSRDSINNKLKMILQ